MGRPGTLRFAPTCTGIGDNAGTYTRAASYLHAYFAADKHVGADCHESSSRSSGNTAACGTRSGAWGGRYRHAAASPATSSPACGCDGDGHLCAATNVDTRADQYVRTAASDGDLDACTDCRGRAGVNADLDTTANCNVDAVAECNRNFLADSDVDAAADGYEHGFAHGNSYCFGDSNTFRDCHPDAD